MINEYLKEKRALVNMELESLLPAVKEEPQLIHRAMRYALKGGKRLRPILCLASSELVKGKIKQAIKTACAIEMIHTYSLIHDDLPSMDNDDYRRGQPSCHKKFGTANAILTGDALLTLAFNVIAEATSEVSLNIRIIKELSNACGTFGIIGGQAIDISNNEKDIPTVEYINIHKTAALIAACCKTGAIVARAREKDIKTLFKFGEYAGLAFQIVDDIFDEEGIAKILGRRLAYQQAAELVKKAKSCISYFGIKAETLYSLADFMLCRNH